MSDPWIYKGWDCDPPDYEEPNNECPACSGEMSEYVYIDEGQAMCEECCGERCDELWQELTTFEKAQLLKIQYIKKENWDGN